jgi:transcriptional regulator with XRE-family HTH domain
MADTDPQVVGGRIAKRRHQLGWTQIQLAERLGVSPSTVANWERGASYPKKKLGLVEQVLGVPLDEPEPERDPVSPRLRQVAVEELGEQQGAFVVDAIRAALQGRDVPRRNLPRREAAG